MMGSLDIALAFVEGLALIASPCILPVLPLVLSASVDGGRQRPFGIIIGFVLSFSIFALISRKIVVALGIDLDVIKDISLGLLFIFGLVLLSSKLSEKFNQLTQGAANLGTKVASSGGDGLLSGVVIGALIGLVWTPCAGPILASVLVQVIRQQSDLAGYLVILSFSIGAGVPMLIIALMGRKIMKRLGFLSNHAEIFRKVFGVLIIASVVFIASGIDPIALFHQPPKAEAIEVSQLKSGLREGLDQPYPAPEFKGIDGWLNSPELTLKSLHGKVVLIDFWTYSCINCVRTLPYLTDWDQKYRDRGLVIIGVHSPEFEFEKKIENVKLALGKYGIHYPVALDNRLETWGRFNNQYWPAHYLINQQGQVVYTHFGEGKYDQTEHNIRYLLGIDAVENTENSSTKIQNNNETPETYLGYARADGFDGQALIHDQKSSYQFPADIKKDHWALQGYWNIGSQKLTALKDSALKINFNARKVFLVLGTKNTGPVQAQIILNGHKTSLITIDHQGLYELIDQKTAKKGTLEIQAPVGLEAYAFTFES